MILLRSLTFNTFFFLTTPVFSILVMLFRPFGFHAAWFWGRMWSRLVLLLARMICGIRIEVEGREHLPSEPCVVMAKHQSALETIAMPSLIPPFVWVLKRELFYIPIFGWALWMLDAIAIRRSKPRVALKQILNQGQEFLRRGRWVVIFPEGHRQKPGVTGNYQASGIMLARLAGVGILPMAHNAGRCWPKYGFIKKPGVVRVRFLPFIPYKDVTNSDRNAILEKVKEQIESATRELGG
jgi:1-acyl-sn-glycerol-3-phosphate acyltransferase